MVIKGESLGVFISRYQDRWKAVNKPNLPLDDVDVTKIQTELKEVLFEIGYQSGIAIQKYP